MSRARGFTLIELLVVIAIIAILAAILFPVFARAREGATKISCVSNLKQLATVLIMYAEDHDGALPGGWETGWARAAAPYGTMQEETASDDSKYMALSGMMKCPGSGNGYGPDINALWVSTHPNGYLGGAYLLTDFKSPTRQCYIWESNSDQHSSIGDLLTAGMYHQSVSVSPGEACYIASIDSVITKAVARGYGGIPDHWTAHRGGSNIAFIDGHVKWASTGEIISPNGWPRWMNYPQWPIHNR